MKLLRLVWATVLASLVAGDAVNDLEAKGRLQINDYLASGSKTCTKDKLSVRKEWGDISKPERRAYIDAVLCLLKAPSKLDSKQFPGAKSRYDDFVVVHMNQTLTIHNTGNFLSWHRYYIWSWENVLRKECGYKGTLPYWDYGRWAKDPLSSPIFDGSDTSLGGNGSPSVQHANLQPLASTSTSSARSRTTSSSRATGTTRPGGNGGSGRPGGTGGVGGTGAGAGTGAGTGAGGWGGTSGGMPGMGGGMPGMGDTSGGFGGGFSGGFGGMGSGGRTGGGCVTTGPFKNMTIYLGPLSPVATPSPPRNSMSNGYGANPRCLRRDITNTLGMQYGKTSDIATFITSFTKVLDFQNYMQGGSGIHGVGHFTVSGDPGGDFYISPNEPSFWIHHAMIDRTWVIWQSQDYKNRMMQMEGGTSMMGFSAKQQSLDDLVDLGVVGDKVYKIRDLLSSVDGPFCYVYE